MVASRLVRDARRAGGVRPGANGSDRAAWAHLMGWSYPTGGVNRRATRDEALALPAFGRGVDLLCSAVAGVPLRAYEWDAAAGVDMRLAEQPSVLLNPVPGSNGWQWRYSAVRDLIETGNHVSLLGDAGADGFPQWLFPLPAADVGIVVDATGFHQFTFGGMLLDPSVVFHVSAGTRSGEVLARGVVQQFAGSLGVAVTAEEWAGRYLAGGGVPPAIIQHPGTQTEAERSGFKARWLELVAAGGAMILPTGATVTPLQSDADRQQLVEARKWNTQLQAMVLGIPSVMLGIEGPSMTYQNAEQADIGFIRDSVRRWADPIGAALSAVCLPPGLSARFEWGSRDRSDEATQIQNVAGLLAAAVITADEARQKLGYAPLRVALAAGSTPEGVPQLAPLEVVQ